MSKTKTINLEVVTHDQTALKERRDRIVAYHQGFMNAFAQQAGYAFLAGVELNAAKEELGPRGGFIEWREQNLPQISKGSADNYRAFATAMQEKFPTVGNITSERLQLTDGRLREKDQQLILEAVHAAADGSSLTKLYRELGVIKTPTAKAAPGPRKDLSPQDAHEAVKLAAEERIKKIITDLELITEEERALISNALRDQFYDALLTETSALRELKSGGARSTRAPQKKGSRQ
jgi:hypothetical protein